MLMFSQFSMQCLNALELPRLLRLHHLHQHCRLLTEKFVSADLLEGESLSNQSDYNHGLPGKGKERSKHMQQKWFHKSVQPLGEIIFGTMPVLLALAEGRRDVHCVYLKRGDLDGNKRLTEIAALAVEKGMPVKYKGRMQLDALSCNRPHQGVCMDVGKLSYANDDMLPVEPYHADDGKPALWLLLDCIQDPMNFGAVLRSSYFFGVDRVLTVKGNSSPMSPVVSKASAGVLEIMPIYQVSQLFNFLQLHKSLGWQLLAASAVSATASPGSCSSSTCDVESFALKRPSILIIGNEGLGVSDDIRNLCHLELVVNPRRELTPYMDSLNVSVATGVLLFSLLSRRSSHSS